MYPDEVVRIAEYIKTMKIRGAGRIARAAAQALKIAASEYRGDSLEDFRRYIHGAADLLRSTRPTAVSLPNAISYVLARLERSWNELKTVEDAKKVVISAAEDFIEFSVKATQVIGEIGSRLIRDGYCVLTHCNSAVAAAVITHAHKSGKRIRVYATETRPKFQGYITVKWLADEGLDVTLIPDSAVRLVMKKVDCVVVGADTVTANGAVVNKIGTSLIALAAKEANVDFYVATESYKFSPSTVVGELVEIEERSPEEVVPREYLEKNPGIVIRNPAFDITPPEYIDAIITEKGVIPPQGAILVLKEEYGWVISDYVLKATQDIDSSIYG